MGQVLDPLQSSLEQQIYLILLAVASRCRSCLTLSCIPDFQPASLHTAGRYISQALPGVPLPYSNSKKKSSISYLAAF